MWTRKELKDRAKVTLKANYWKAVLVSLILSPVPYIIQLVLRGVAQVVERYFREVEAASSSLVTPTEGLRAAMFLNLFWYFKEYRNEIRGKRA